MCLFAEVYGIHLLCMISLILYILEMILEVLNLCSQNDSMRAFVKYAYSHAWDNYL